MVRVVCVGGGEGGSGFVKLGLGLMEEVDLGAVL